MQWKRVRDQHTQATQKLTTLCRQVTNLESQLEVQLESHRKETQATIERLRKELDSSKDHSRKDHRVLAERIDMIGQLIAGERGHREANASQLNKSLQGIRETMNAERVNTKQEVDKAIVCVDDAKKLLDIERDARQAGEDRCKTDMTNLQQGLDEACASLKAELSQVRTRLEEAAIEAAQAVEAKCLSQLERLAARVDEVTRATTEATASTSLSTGRIRGECEAANTRLMLLESRCSALETCLTEGQKQPMEAVEQLTKRHECVFNGM